MAFKCHGSCLILVPFKWWVLSWFPPKAFARSWALWALGKKVRSRPQGSCKQIILSSTDSQPRKKDQIEISILPQRGNYYHYHHYYQYSGSNNHPKLSLTRYICQIHICFHNINKQCRFHCWLLLNICALFICFALIPPTPLSWEAARLPSWEVWNRKGHSSEREE